MPGRGRDSAFEIADVLRRVRKAVASYPKAALFALWDEGFTSLFEILTACIISIRTRDEVTVVAARSLFALARTPHEIAGLDLHALDGAISLSTFHFAKAAQIQTIARETAEHHNGVIPCDRDVLLSFRGVGPKCANLALGIACGQQLIGVDIHVHRIVNRWGYVAATTPERTMEALEQKLPRRYRIEINNLLVPFGKRICTGALPRCSTCPVLDSCAQAGVTSHR